MRHTTAFLILGVQLVIVFCLLLAAALLGVYGVVELIKGMI